MNRGDQRQDIFRDDDDWPPAPHLRSNLEGLQISHTLLGQFPGLLDKVVFDAANFGGGKGLDPIDAAFAEGNLGVSLLAPCGGRTLRRGSLEICAPPSLTGYE